MSGPLRLEFVTSADDHRRLPAARTEIAIVGRSNVGKSSLLNALAHRKDLAHTSKTPGRTRLLNCFALAEGRHVVDCPGYGYAAAPQAERGRWQQMMERYILEREGLVMVVALVDGEIGPTALDRQLLEWLRANDVPFTVVATKHDKVKSSARQRRARDLAAGCEVEPSEVVWVSASKGTGIDRLRTLVRTWLGA